MDLKIILVRNRHHPGGIIIYSIPCFDEGDVQYSGYPVGVLTNQTATLIIENFSLKLIW